MNRTWWGSRVENEGEEGVQHRGHYRGSPGRCFVRDLETRALVLRASNTRRYSTSMTLGIPLLGFNIYFPIKKTIRYGLNGRSFGASLGGAKCVRRSAVCLLRHSDI